MRMWLLQLLPVSMHSHGLSTASDEGSLGWYRPGMWGERVNTSERVKQASVVQMHGPGHLQATHPGLGVDARPAVQQRVDHVDPAPLGSDVQRGDVVAGGVVHRGAALQQQGGDVDVAVVGGNVQRREPALHQPKGNNKRTGVSLSTDAITI